MRKTAAVFVAAIAVTLVPHLAWGVLRIEATGGSGPIELRIEEADGNVQHVTTDASGRATVTTKPGPVKVEAKGDHVGKQTVEVPPTGDASTTLRVKPLAGWMVQNPGGIPGNFGLGFLFESLSWDPEITRDRLILISPSGARDVIDTPPSDSNRHVDVDVDLNVYALDVPVSLTKLDLGSFVLFLAASLRLGMGDIDVKATDRETREKTTFSDSDMFLFGGELEALLAPCGTCPWFAALAFGGETNFGSDVERSPGLGIPGVREDLTLHYHRWHASARAGRTFRFSRPVTPYAGVAWEERNVELDGRAVDAATGAAVEFQNDLKSDGLLGFVGVDAQIWDPVFGRLMVSFDDANVSVLLKVVYLFGVGGR